MNGPDAGRGTGRSSAYPALAVVVAVGVLVVVVTAVVLLGTRDDDPAETVTGPTGPGTTSTPPRSPRPTTTAPAPDTTLVTAPAAVCDARVINTDLGYPDSGARIIDCGGGWAVMAGEISGDPFWVVFRNGRWLPADGVSIYTMTCPDEAIAMGAPAWMAHEHLVTCRTSDWSVASSDPRPGPPAAPAASSPRSPRVQTSPATSVRTATVPSGPAVTAPPSPTSQAPSTTPTAPASTSPERTASTGIAGEADG